MRLDSCLAILLALIYPSCQLNSTETCEFCSAVLRGVHGFFASSSSAPSKRLLARQLKHHCNRHFNYRRRCLILVKTNFHHILEAMRHSPFKPTDTCFAINECQTESVEIVAPLFIVDNGPLERELELFFASFDEGRTVF